MSARSEENGVQITPMTLLHGRRSTRSSPLRTWTAPTIHETLEMIRGRGEMTVALLLIAGLLVAFANGANDNFKGVATLLGSGTADYRRALLWATICTLLGSFTAVFLAGELLKKFSGQGLVSDALTTHVDYAAAVASGSRTGCSGSDPRWHAGLNNPRPARCSAGGGAGGRVAHQRGETRQRFRVATLTQPVAGSLHNSRCVSPTPRCPPPDGSFCGHVPLCWRRDC